MTNLEFYKDEIEERFKQLFKSFTDTSSLACALDETYLKHRKQKCESMFTWYFEEHKEPIKLKQWERDLLASLYNTAEDRFVYMGVFKYHAILRNMKLLGHFKGVTDEDMSLAKILDNCEVVE